MPSTSTDLHQILTLVEAAFGFHGRGGGLNQPPLLIPHLNGQIAPMTDFLSSGHLKRFLGISFDPFFICIPLKNDPLEHLEQALTRGNLANRAKSEQCFFGSRAPM